MSSSEALVLLLCGASGLALTLLGLSRLMDALDRADERYEQLVSEALSVANNYPRGPEDDPEFMESL